MGYTLIVTEKPTAADKIAAALSNGRAEKLDNGGAPYYRLERGGKKIVVAPAVGHLFVLTEAEKKVKWHYPVFGVKWVPTIEQKRNKWAMKYFRSMEKLASRAKDVISACDYDIEGCTPYSERIVVKENGNTRITTMGKLYDEVTEQQRTTKWKEFDFAEPKNDVLVSCIDPNTSNLSFKKIMKVMRRRGDSSILKITTETGREIHVSRSHPMFVLSEEGIIVKDACKVGLGDYLPVSKELPYIKPTINEIDIIEEAIRRDRKTEFYVYGIKSVLKLMPAEISKKVGVERKTALAWRFWDRMPLDIYLKLEESARWRSFLKIGPKKSKTKLPAILPLDKKLGNLVGYYLSEGCTDTSGFIGLYFGGHEKELAEKAESIFFSLLGVLPKKRYRNGMKGTYGQGNGWEVGTKSKMLNFVFSDILDLGRNAHEKKLPESILSMPNDFVSGVMDSYLVGDGSFFKTRDRFVVSAASKSKELIEGLHLLFLKKGIVSNLVHDWKNDKFYIHIGVRHNIRKLIEIGAASLIPDKMRDSIMEARKTDMKRDCFSYLPNFMLNGCKVSARTRINMNYSQRTSIPSLLSMTPQIERITNSNVHYLKVSKIEEIPNETEHLYDIETETGSFLHGNGIVTHNSVIAWNIIRFICKTRHGKRMKFSTLTPGDLVEAYDNASPKLDHPQIEAGLARHQMDWLFGINISRALTLSLEHSGGYWVLSTGRVQGPTLKILEDRQREIERFKPTPFWELNLHASVNGKNLTAGHEKDKFWKRSEAESIHRKCSGKDGSVKEVEKKQVKANPPVPFDLTSLQREAYSRFGYSPKQTLDYAQHLYEHALISYPRTSSQKLPAKLGFRDIIKKLSSQLEYGELAGKLLAMPSLKPKEGKKSDPAHPAIYPTGHKSSRLTSYQKKVYDMIVRRFMAVFAEPALREQTRVVITIEGEDFVAHGVRTLQANWMEFYMPYLNIKEQILPQISRDDPVKNRKLDMFDKQTEPPNRYSQASILKAMEDLNLGTKATRAGILQTLYDRAYIKERSIQVTDLGEAVVGALEKHSPEIVSVELTKKFDKEMEAIEEGKLKRDDVIKDVEKDLGRILDEFKKHEKEIGTHMLKAVREYEKEIHTVGTCNKCNKGELRMIHSRRTGKRFVGCSNYPKCSNSFPLPQHGFVQAVPTLCKCGLHLIEVRPGGRRPWRFCVRHGFEYRDTPKGASKKSPAKPGKPVKKAPGKASSPAKLKKTSK